MQSISTQALAWQPGRLDRRKGRSMIAAGAGVDAVHLLELLHIEQEYAAPEHVLQVRAGRLQDGPHVLQALLGLGLDVGSGGAVPWRIGSALARHENQAIEVHARRVGTDRLGQVGGVNGLAWPAILAGTERGMVPFARL